MIDTGIGMSEKQLESLFRPFAQPDDSMVRHFSGSGLGLMISKRLAAALGGDITVTSEPDKGSTFTLTVATGPLDGVPSVENPEEALRSLVQVASAPAAVKLDCRILLAEDGPDNRRLISLLLEKAGAEVTVVEDGQEAVNQVLAAERGGEHSPSGPARPFDMVLMDLQMPVMDGFEATRCLRKRGYNGVILALTGYAMPQDIEQCLIVGCNAHLSKPINRETLLRTIAQFLKPPALLLPGEAREGETLLADAK